MPSNRTCSCLDYHGTVTASVDSKFLGIIRYVIWIIILSYIIISTMADYGYQKKSPILSYVTIKLKKTDFSGSVLLDDEISDVIPGKNSSLTLPEDFRVWEIANLFVPHQETGVFFVITNIVVKTHQHVGFDNSKRNCNPDKPYNCVIGEPVQYDSFSTSVMTGKCTNNSCGKHTCETSGWVSDNLTQKDRDDRPLYVGSQYFELLIKNLIRFPLFPQYRTMNIKHDDEIFDKRSNCTYDKDIRPFCAKFTLGSIIEAVGQNYSEISRRGGVIRININWNCNLDYNPKKCIPKYTFRRLDDRNQDNFRHGWKFRYAVNLNDTHRIVYKAYGVKFDVSVSGIGRKFDFVHCSRTVGSELAYFGIATIVCQFVLSWCMPSKAKKCRYHGCNCEKGDAIVRKENQCCQQKRLISL